MGILIIAETKVRAAHQCLVNITLITHIKVDHEDIKVELAIQYTKGNAEYIPCILESVKCQEWAKY